VDGLEAQVAGIEGITNPRSAGDEAKNVVFCSCWRGLFPGEILSINGPGTWDCNGRGIAACACLQTGANQAVFPERRSPVSPSPMSRERSVGKADL